MYGFFLKPPSHRCILPQFHPFTFSLLGSCSDTRTNPRSGSSGTPVFGPCTHSVRAGSASDGRAAGIREGWNFSSLCSTSSDGLRPARCRCGLPRGKYACPRRWWAGRRRCSAPRWRSCGRRREAVPAPRAPAAPARSAVRCSNSAGFENVFRLGAVEADALDVRSGPAWPRASIASGVLATRKARAWRDSRSCRSPAPTGSRRSGVRTACGIRARRGIGIRRPQAREDLLRFAGFIVFFAAARRIRWSGSTPVAAGSVLLRLRALERRLHRSLPRIRDPAVRPAEPLPARAWRARVPLLALAPRQVKRMALREASAPSSRAMSPFQGASSAGAGTSSWRCNPPDKAATHRSQPVHNAAITVCMHLARADDGIDRTGLDAQGAADAARSRRSRDRRRRSVPLAGLSGFGSRRSSRSEPGYAGRAAGRALIDVGLARRDGFGVGQAAAVAAFGALGLRQQPSISICIGERARPVMILAPQEARAQDFDRSAPDRDR